MFLRVVRGHIRSPAVKGARETSPTNLSNKKHLKKVGFVSSGVECTGFGARRARLFLPTSAPSHHCLRLHPPAPLPSRLRSPRTATSTASHPPSLPLSILLFTIKCTLLPGECAVLQSRKGQTAEGEAARADGKPGMTERRSELFILQNWLRGKSAIRINICCGASQHRRFSVSLR